ncbi:isoprenylcysteine carboxylmethyltransferase family protein [Streptomyces sp. 7-21]|uniref:methyltransferase family protein n=1 Tax=Streptomyces sp. 7-21 TaxID=2802283 RepID=UPI00191F40CE|nr:isoprenylcysteine carboxylmethyltransferase family protein [Streptomyces sp. 7-21]MBL1065550.1 isoprenylcysteine carboxylmethyltransferase family protein [Streptomyces sp. 7-21]
MRTGVAAAASAAFFVVPLFIVGVVPWLLTGWDSPYDWSSPGLLPLRAVGVVLIVLGAPNLIRAFARFVTEGHGTPMPPAPCDRLVIGGPYSRVRNPMFVSALGVIFGQALLFADPALGIYGAGVWAFFAFYVYVREEPKLSRIYGEQYDVYRAAVPAWRPRLRPWRGPGDGGAAASG